jgi:hypothetical protein
MGVPGLALADRGTTSQLPGSRSPAAEHKNSPGAKSVAADALWGSHAVEEQRPQGRCEIRLHTRSSPRGQKPPPPPSAERLQMCQPATTRNRKPAPRQLVAGPRRPGASLSSARSTRPPRAGAASSPRKTRPIGRISFALCGRKTVKPPRAVDARGLPSGPPKACSISALKAASSAGNCEILKFFSSLGNWETGFASANCMNNKSLYKNLVSQFPGFPV